jgi:hypothetical protein
MKIVKQTKEKITLELTPIELELLRGAIVKENNSRRKAWKKVNPVFPEELMYHVMMADTSKQMRVEIYKGIKKYQDWGILK